MATFTGVAWLAIVGADLSAGPGQPGGTPSRG